MRSAATAESTPPDSAQITRPSPTWALTLATDSSMNDAVFQSRLQPQASRKLARTLRPSAVWLTSGWNWMPKRPRRASSMAAMGVLCVAAVTENPRGRRRSESPWLIHTLVGEPTPSKSREPSLRSSSAWPNSRQPAPFTSPPRRWPMRCMP